MGGAAAVVTKVFKKEPAPAPVGCTNSSRGFTITSSRCL